MKAGTARASVSPFGRILQEWRRARGKSQLTLALDAGISPRHLSFIESGRSNPSREMVVLLAGVLGMPLRERNDLLAAAGFAHVYKETGLGEQELERARIALDFILKQQEPYPAVVMDRHWNLVMTNEGAKRFFGFLLGESSQKGPANVIRLMFDPEGLRPLVADWEATAQGLLQRVHREALGGVPDEETIKLLQEVLAYPDVPASWRTPDLQSGLMPILPVQFRKDGRAFNYFSTVTTLGTPQDITLQEIRIECFFPADEATEQAARQL